MKHLLHGLILIPTPIDEESKLHPGAQELLQSLNVESDVILVEELRECRRRWLRWGLPREWVDRFVVYNEHTRDELKSKVLADLKAGKRHLLMSDCGLPAFCDPGQELVDLCHTNHINVSATSFENSIALAIALSGFSHQEFHFYGFLPQKSDVREGKIHTLLKQKWTSIVMDTPYRLSKLLQELVQAQQQLQIHRRYFLAMNLNQSQQLLLRGELSFLLKHPAVMEKQEFILLVSE
jgi:16S rRNA (cytidine1402-2'-O)-methyltransferase